MSEVFKNTLKLSIVILSCLGLTDAWALNSSLPLAEWQTQEPDSIYTGTRFESIDSKGNNPFAEKSSSRSMQLNDASSLNYTSEYDPATGQVHFYRKIGNIDVKLPYSMTVEEYMNEDVRNSMLAYWDQRARSAGDENDQFSIFNPNFNVNSELLGNIFGNNMVNIKPQGVAELRIGVTTSKIDNPTLQENLRKTTTFDFQEKIQMNIQGTIGDKLKMGINYNTEATFEFENQMNLEYEGKEDDILRSVEAGNVTLPLPGTLITGSQSLFGVKTEMQFGKLSVTSIFSQQKGETSVLDIQGGAQKQEFDMPVNEYDKNRHFFLSHFFRNLYDETQKTYPMLPRINVQRVEIWVTNRSGNFNEARNIIAFADLGESGGGADPDTNPYMVNPEKWGSTGMNVNPRNDANTLYSEMDGTYNAVRDINQVTTVFRGITGFEESKGYEKIENARLLSETEYTLNRSLGFISLNMSLNADEVLAIAYEYDYNGQTFRVGEFANNGIDAPNTLYLKMLKSTNLTPSVKPSWDLMMKNVYAIGAYQVNREDFIFDVAYVDDSTGTAINYFPDEVPNNPNMKGKLLLRIMNLDKLNETYDPYPDGFFDYINDQTIYPQNGRVIFPVLEPFGSFLEGQLGGDKKLIEKYVYQSLYDETSTIAEQDAEKNKFRLRGSYKSSVSNEISLNAQNIPQGSVIVTAGGIKLVENVDYTVDYSFGTVKIINQGLLASGSPIQVSLESQSLFNLQTKTMLGTHMNYQINKDFNIGGTVMHLSERPLTQKVNIGDEPISNTIYGFNTSYYSETQWLTNALDKIPLLSVKDVSSIAFEGEYAQLVPGSPSVVGNQAYIDDFEGTKISIDMRNWTAWSIAGTPQDPDLFPESDLINDLEYGYQRGKLAWYIIDPLFSRSNQFTPQHIKDDLDEQSNHFSREVFEKEIFPDRQAVYGQATNIPVLNVAYYPKERGVYNFSTDVEENGELRNPENNWGGIMRRVETNDFEAANIEFIEFWMMDPFVYNQNIQKAGDLYFNLGNISEDVLRDSRKFFEQGLPGPNDIFEDNVDSTKWGYVPKQQSLVNAFSNDPATRLAQDVGLNGMPSSREQVFYAEYIAEMQALLSSGGLSSEAYDKIMADPASDDYHYFRGSDYDQDKTSILDRYKNFNGPEGNAIPSEYSPESYATAATTLPDQEDVNRDNTLSENESYYQYKVRLDPNEMIIGQNYITDKVEAEVDLKNGNTEKVNWYQFRIPINQPDKTVGSISDTRSIRFMRMFMHNFSDTTILRFATLDLVRSEWRIYGDDLEEDNENVVPNDDTKFEVGAVNIEENASKQPVPYVLPPGVDRVIDPANPQLRELNEQSILLKVTDIAKNDRRAVFKTLNMDMRQYGKLKMEVHAEEIVEGTIGKGRARAFIRLGSDARNNYYEYEIPLSMTPHNATDPEAIWPAENRFDFAFEKLQAVKLLRNNNNYPVGDVYTMKDDENWVKIKGNPNIGNVRTIVIGIRSMVSEDLASFETWFNELRLTDFNEEGGWAANARVNIKLSDFGNVSVAGNTSSIGFGSIEKSVAERSQEDFYQYDIAANLDLGKFTGANTRMTIPFYYGTSQEVSTPKYFPLDPDIPLKVALDNAESSEERDSIKNISQDVIKRKSYNFTNVRLQPKSNKSRVYDISNLSASYSFSETEAHNINTEKALDRDYRGVLGYNFNNRPKAIEPFKKSKALKGEAFKLIKDFNFYLMPTQLSYRTEMMRNTNEQQLRVVNNPDYVIPKTQRRDFYWNRYFDLRFNLTKNLKFDFKSTVNARIDEIDPLYDIDDPNADPYYESRDRILDNIKSGGRTTNYLHNFNVSYKIPIDKLPYLNWTTSTIRYSGMYNWVAAPLQDSNDPDALNWGNTISNSNNIQSSTQLNFTTLYNRSKYLKGLSRKYGNSRSSQKKSTKRTVRYNKEKVKLAKGQSYIINHKLKTTEIRVRVFDENGRTAKGETTPISETKAEFIPSQDYDNARIMVTGTVEDKTTILGTAVDYSAMFLTGVKNFSVNYTETNGTILPGYLPDSKFLGSSTYQGNSAPGYAFIAGWQDRDYAQKAADNGWITTDSINQAYAMTHQEDLSLKATIEPIKGLRIDLTANRRYSNNMNEYYRQTNGMFEATNTRESGNFTMSINSFSTAFEKVDIDGTYESKNYQTFLDNRVIVAERLANERLESGIDENYTSEDAANQDGYGLNSQEVLIPAFLAAYGGKDPNNIFTELFPSLAAMRPNWRITYDGLGRIKLFKNVLRSFDISHGYRSTYNVGSYITDTDYGFEEDGVTWIRDAQSNFLPQFQVNSVTINETFSPLLAFNITWKNNMTTRLETKKARTLNLSLANKQLIENHNQEYVIGVGYRFDKMDLIFGGKGGQKKMSSDLNLRADISVRDNVAIIRKIEEGVDQLTSGQKITTLKFTADYVLSDRFNMQVFYDRAINSPYISLSYPTTNSNFGVSFRFSLTE
ncbi:cell surface protein SprA [Saccharicrinis aurantiacus]|uniref:T9SS outer membrane translocon Sov/SprA n=1 Tax=Saccharicrinis aurantiacus TaxID=1849719 RepID=UPI0024905DD7|nr:cell surface protein SprA [Saccharicrinis aurantiacus]